MLCIRYLRYNGFEIFVRGRCYRVENPYFVIQAILESIKLYHAREFIRLGKRSKSKDKKRYTLVKAIVVRVTLILN